MSAIRADSTRRAVAQGSIDPNGRSMVACRFDEELFQQIYTLARSLNISFAEAVRMLCRESLKARAERQAA